MTSTLNFDENVQVSGGVKNLISRLLQKDATQRYITNDNSWWLLSFTIVSVFLWRNVRHVLTDNPQMQQMASALQQYLS